MNSFKSYAPALAIAAVIAVSAPFMRPAKAQQRNTPQPAVVVLTGGEDYDSTGRVIGYFVQTVSTSTGAPAIKIGDDLAQALATLRGQGFEISIHGWGWLTYTAIR